MPCYLPVTKCTTGYLGAELLELLIVLLEQIQFEIYFGLIDLKASSLLLQRCGSIAEPRAA